MVVKEKCETMTRGYRCTNDAIWRHVVDMVPADGASPPYEMHGGNFCNHCKPMVVSLYGDRVVRIV